MARTMRETRSNIHPGGDAMKAKKTSKSTRARKATRDLPLAGRAASGQVAGGQKVDKVEDNMAKKSLLRSAGKALE